MQYLGRYYDTQAKKSSPRIEEKYEGGGLLETASLEGHAEPVPGPVTKLGESQKRLVDRPSWC